MLIDTNGKIAFKGHPAMRPDLVADFNALLKGETITGDGTGPSAGQGEEKANEGKELDLEAVSKELEAFESTASEWAKDEEMKKLAAGMPRAFCVMELESKTSPQGKTLSSFKNYRVLVGKQEQVDALKARYSALEGSFSVELREHVM